MTCRMMERHSNNTLHCFYFLAGHTDMCLFDVPHRRTHGDRGNGTVSCPGDAGRRTRLWGIRNCQQIAGPEHIWLMDDQFASRYVLLQSSSSSRPTQPQSFSAVVHSVGGDPDRALSFVCAFVHGTLSQSLSRMMFHFSRIHNNNDSSWMNPCFVPLPRPRNTIKTASPTVCRAGGLEQTARQVFGRKWDRQEVRRAHGNTPEERVLFQEGRGENQVSALWWAFKSGFY